MKNTNILTDKNNREMKTGDIVKIENAYFKNDNGYYYIAHTPGDITWCGSDYSLKKINKSGKISTAARSIAFWPLKAFCNDKLKNAAANEHNKQYATIEIIDDINTDGIIEEFQREADANTEAANTYSFRFGETSEITCKTEAIAAFYQSIADGLRAGKTETTTEEEPEAIENNEEGQTAFVFDNVVKASQLKSAPDPVEDLICEPELVSSVVYDFGALDEEAAPEPEEETAHAKKYYDVSEETARRGHESVHMSDYKPGSATNEYKSSVDEVYAIAEKQKKKVSEYYHDKIDALADKYAKRLAQWTNDYNRNSASCPSWFICGPANYPVKKHERQMSRERSLWKEYDDIKGIIEKIKAVGTGAVDLADPNAKEMLSERLEKYKKELEHSKEINAYWRKHKSLVGFPEMDPEKAEEMTKSIEESLQRHPWISSPVPGYELTSLRDKIKRTTERLEELNRRQETPNSENEYEGFTVIENNDVMRLQIIFPDKPDEVTRNILKSNGFKWAPSQNAWQRQLTDNSRRALKRIIKELQPEMN